MRGATLPGRPHELFERHFNPRSSCEERLGRYREFYVTDPFQSTLLMRGATRVAFMMRKNEKDFNPRSSCEERLIAVPSLSRSTIFQSTLLMRGATVAFLKFF